MADEETPQGTSARLRAWGSQATAFARRCAGWVRRHPWRTVAIPPLLVAAWVLALIPFTPSVADLRKFRTEVPAVVLSSDGVVIAEYRRVNRRWVPLEGISPRVVDALIATEDRRFYSHHGIDVVRTAGALVRTLRGDRQGGSTITQQLARNLFPEDIGRAPTLTRKVKEAITALKIEAVYSKNEILEVYLNTVPFLYNAFGIEMAARTYFDTSADKLDVLQSATLVAMLKGTAAYNPVLNPERALARRNLVLTQMAQVGKLDPTRVAALQKRPLGIDFERQDEIPGPAPHVAQFLRKWLIEWADRNGYDIYADGLVVRTTLDGKLQKAAVQAVVRQGAQLQSLVDRRVRKGETAPTIQAGFVAMDPRSGFIRAWVGSRDFAKEQFDHVAQARRQPGSTFKPFVYAAAFEAGMHPSFTYQDAPVSYRLAGGEVWSPNDVAPPTMQQMSLRDGLVFSKNRITAQVMHNVGPERVAKTARAMGVRDSKLEAVPSLALGTSPVTLREMVAAYAPIANGGLYAEPHLVLSIERRDGELLAQFAYPDPERAISRATSLLLVDVMRGVVDEGTGTAIRSRFGIQADVAGKTGTTQDNSDGWFLLVHRQLVGGAWVGFNDPAVKMGDWGEGARSALPIVGDVFQQALRNRWIDPQAEFDIPRPKREPPRREDPVVDFFSRLFAPLFRRSH
ncbi:penicillin-binding protein 1A [Ramlibacter sp. PS4R-6]|uniref:penicillin-binding protein 1A n=1 Tax=Ramlibacter sp. PS4R-6 TaxID=3133438 RepID=UPI0030996F18